jgi:hypothetical protein
LTIEWTKASLLNLIARRAAQNATILDHVRRSRDVVLATADSQKAFFDDLFPEQVEVGVQKSSTLDWLIGRTRDGTRQPAPRELIHLLNSLRDVQVRRLEIGDPDPENNRLFSRAVFKEALPQVSKTRLEQTLFAEYPEIKTYVEQLRGQKTQQTSDTLAAIWKLSTDETTRVARMLVELGFFEERGERDEPIFWVPFLYRDALDLVQGAAE